tara:strand:+ start:1151 stop:3625 length:2475 start_codon:yes stop_codon:yes gene_type:complete
MQFPSANPSQILATLEALFVPDQIVEMRVLAPNPYGGKARVKSGYFNKLELLATTAAACSNEGAIGVYITPNKINPALFARSPNKMTQGLPATSDDDVQEHTYLLIDIDSLRPAHVSASKEEKQRAFSVARTIYRSFSAEGWPKPIVGDSGNGAHLIYRVNLKPNDPIIRRFYSALSLFFDVEGVTIDQKVFNPARIWKLYGTAVRKGSSVEGREHRLAHVLDIPSEFSRCSKKLVEQFAKRAPENRGSLNSAKARRLDLWIGAHMPTLGEAISWGDKGRKWVLPECPFDETHNDNSAYIVQTHSGEVYAGCLHQKCVGSGRKGWRAFQSKFGKFRGGKSEEDGPAQNAGSTSSVPGLTDLGNAKRLVEKFGHEVKWVPSWRKWVNYTGKRWELDDTGRIMRLAEETTADVFMEAASENDTNRSEKLYKHAVRSESAGSLHSMVTLASSEAGMSVPVGNFDKDHWKLNTANGTIDLTTGQLLPFARKDLITKICPVEYNPNADSPIWDNFLHEILQGRLDLISFLYRYLGYSLTGSVREQKLLFCYGTGANGKSTFLNTVQHMMGTYAKQAAPELLVASKSGRHPTEVADLMGARMVVSAEIDRGRSLAEASIKQMTGGDPIKARYMKQDFFEFLPTHKLWLAANHKPIIKGNDEGIWRRVLLVPFEVNIPEAKQDKNLESKLLGELPGILNRVVAGCLDWQRNGLNIPLSVKRATQEYREELDLMKPFFDDRCDVNENHSINPKNLYNAYIDWCEDNHAYPMKTSFFNMLMRERSFKQGKPCKKGSATTYRPWLGIKLRDEAPVSPKDLGQLITVDQWNENEG